jgi:Ca-activated chloride channel homolog
MKALRVLIIVSICSVAAALIVWGQGPVTSGSETVAKKKPTTDSSSTTDSTDPNASSPANNVNPVAPPVTNSGNNNSNNSANSGNNNGTIPSEFKKDKTAPQNVPTFHTDALTVSVDVAVLDNNGHFIPRIPQGNFRVLEDNQPQKINGFSMGEAPMTIAMVIEFSNKFESLYGAGWFQVLNATYGFVQTLKPEDYVAVIAYDLRPEILSDFSANRQDTYEALQRLRIPGFSEANLYDAMVETAKRMQDIEGRKAILLMSSGVDTFSKLTYDQARRSVQDAGVPIYGISLLQFARLVSPRGDSIGFLQADNGMRTFAKESGGMAFFPRFYGEMGQIYQEISQAMRNQYVISYAPSNQERDGKYRKIKVELINPQTNEPLRVVDQKNKPIKYSIVAKNGYTAPRPVE